MMKSTQRFYRKYFGLCCQWYLAQKKLNWAADFEFALFPYLINGIKNHLEDAYFRDMSGCELAEIEQAAGQRCQPIGHIGYYYPAEVWISAPSTGSCTRNMSIRRKSSAFRMCLP